MQASRKQVLDAVRDRTAGWRQLLQDNLRLVKSQEDRWLLQLWSATPEDAQDSVEDVNGAGDLGALSLLKTVSRIVTTGAATGQLANGKEGQFKTIFLKTDGGDYVLTPANLRVSNVLTFGEAGDTIVLQFVDGQWNVVSNIGVAVS